MVVIHWLLNQYHYNAGKLRGPFVIVIEPDFGLLFVLQFVAPNFRRFLGVRFRTYTHGISTSSGIVKNVLGFPKGVSTRYISKVDVDKVICMPVDRVRAGATGFP